MSRVSKVGSSPASSRQARGAGLHLPSQFSVWSVHQSCKDRFGHPCVFCCLGQGILPAYSHEQRSLVFGRLLTSRPHWDPWLCKGIFETPARWVSVPSCSTWIVHHYYTQEPNLRHSLQRGGKKADTENSPLCWRKGQLGPRYKSWPGLSPYYRSALAIVGMAQNWLDGHYTCWGAPCSPPVWSFLI